MTNIGHLAPTIADTAWMIIQVDEEGTVEKCLDYSGHSKTDTIDAAARLAAGLHPTDKSLHGHAVEFLKEFGRVKIEDKVISVVKSTLS